MGHIYHLILDGIILKFPLMELHLVSIFLKSLTKEQFNDIRIGMKSLGVYDIREILKIEVRKSILHGHQVNFGTNKYESEKVEDSLKSVSSKEVKMKQSLITDYFFGLAEIIIKVLGLQFLERQDKFLKFISRCELTNIQVRICVWFALKSL